MKRSVIIRGFLASGQDSETHTCQTGEQARRLAQGLSVAAGREGVGGRVRVRQRGRTVTLVRGADGAAEGRAALRAALDGFADSGAARATVRPPAGWGVEKTYRALQYMRSHPGVRGCWVRVRRGAGGTVTLERVDQ